MDDEDASDYTDVAAKYHTIFIFGMIFYICSVILGIIRCFTMTSESILVTISSIGAVLIIIGQFCLVITATAVRFGHAGEVCSGLDLDEDVYYLEHHAPYLYSES